MKEEMNAREFAHALNRMCGETMCGSCPLRDIDCDITVTEKENIDKIVEVVTKWANENPETKAEFPDELIVKLKPWEEVLNWASEHPNAKGADVVYGIYRKVYEKCLYGRELRVKRDYSPKPKEYKVYRTVEPPYWFIPDGFFAEIVDCMPNEEKPQPKVYPKHCLVKLVPYEEALKREKKTALPDDWVYGGEPWGMQKTSYDHIQAKPVELKFHKHRNMLDGEHTLYEQVGGREFYIPISS